MRNRAAAMLEPIFTAVQDWERLLQIQEVRLDEAKDHGERVQIMLRYKPAWVRLVPGRGSHHAEYPPMSIADWHERMGLGGGSERRRRATKAKRVPRR